MDFTFTIKHRLSNNKQEEEEVKMLFVRAHFLYI